MQNRDNSFINLRKNTAVYKTVIIITNANSVNNALISTNRLPNGYRMNKEHQTQYIAFGVLYSKKFIFLFLL